jgi:hypothetical protein
LKAPDPIGRDLLLRSESIVRTTHGMREVSVRSVAELASWKVGDEIWALFGGRMPFVVSPRGTKYEFQGEAYLHGIMDGEVLERSTEEDVRRIELV